jgi:hypothetical protein
MDAAPAGNSFSDFQGVEHVSEEFESSVTIAKLAGALAKAQKLIRHASKDSTNPHFKSTYADLSAVIDAVRDPLADNGIARIQAIMSRGDNVGMRTMLAHESGEYIACTVWVSSKTPMSPQQIGSVTTYLRRYSLSAIAGTAQADDDAEAVTVHPAPPKNAPAPAPAAKAKAPKPEPAPEAAPIPLPEGHVYVRSFKQGRWEVTGTEPKITEERRGRIKGLQTEAGVPETEWPLKLTTYYGVPSSTLLSERQGIDLQTRLEQAVTIRNS